MPAMDPLTPIDPRVEMFQKGQPTDSFFNMKALAPRPMSDATEMFDTDFEDDESEIEDNSPRLSLNSTGRRSEATLSSFEEVHTPSPNSQEFHGFNFELAPGKKSVEGPRGPHLFRSSVDSTLQPQEEQEEVLAMSPMTPRPSSIQRTSMNAPHVPQIPLRHRTPSAFGRGVNDLDLDEVAFWTPFQVAQWMYDAGFELSIVEKFEENDISGAILMTLKFEDLRELDIPSFGQRTKLWNEIHVLRGSVPSTPKPATPIDEAMSPCTEFHRPSRRPSRTASRKDNAQDCASDEEPKRRKSSRRRHRKHNDPITPLESVSIVGIEQLMPKPHKCAKGENCSRWRKQQRLIEAFKSEHPMTPEGGYIWVAGDPGNAATTEAIASGVVRPVSDAVPSVVASSDVLGPTLPAFRHLEEATLRNVQLRDPQDNVKQFIKFQHMDPAWSSEEPPTPPYEMFPALNPPHAGLRGLPRLAIPPPRPLVPPSRAASANAFSPYAMERVEAKSPELRNATQSPSVYRFGTPFSEMDVPVTAVPIGPVAREESQSVPPNMSYRHAPLQRTQSRASARRPSFAAMPRVDENIPTTARQTRFDNDQIQTAHPTSGQKQPSSYPWSPIDKPAPRAADDVSHSGYMKKRKTKLLRHEWHEHHFTLKGTRLSMHKDARALETLEYIDVDDYAIACSSLASGSKLNAAFKAMSITRSNGAKDKKDEGAFAFQLIPAVMEKSARLRKRESAMLAGGAAGEGKDIGLKAKTHHFAVRSRDDRIDWMRELMLAKALKQKSEGYEVNVNGNMI